jgi:hypothetical protein
VGAVQFYETTVLITDGSRSGELSVLTASPNLVPKRGRGGTRSGYEVLLDDAEDRMRLALPQLPLALGILGSLSEHSEDAAFALRSAFRPETDRLFLSDAEYLGLGMQAAALPLLPIEASPLEKRSLVELITYGASATLGFYTAGPILMVLGPLGLAAFRGLGGALWEGARPEVAQFGGDAAAWILDAIRDSLGIDRRE